MSDELEIIQPTAMVAMLKAETDIAIETAKKYPRVISKVKANVLAYATCDEETAKACFYAKPVDNRGTLVKGPSIRLAEIIASTWGNIKWGSRIIEIDEKWVTVQGAVMDLENNISYTVELKRSIWSDNQKKRYSENLIQTTSKAAMAIAVRDAVYKVVPMGMFNAELKLIQATATGRDSKIPLEKRVANALLYFKRLGVDEKKVLERLEIQNKADINEDHLETLIGLKTGIEDKEFTVEEAFIPYKKEAQEQKAKDVTSSVKGMMPKKDDAADASKLTDEEKAEYSKTKVDNKGQTSLV
jgi:hypothetical protein